MVARICDHGVYVRVVRALRTRAVLAWVMSYKEVIFIHNIHMYITYIPYPTELRVMYCVYVYLVSLSLYAFITFICTSIYMYRPQRGWNLNI
jgi:hypothetical protein